MIKIKKLLTSLASLGVVASAASLVVSCGPSFNTLETREIDPTVYKTTFSNNIQNWNMAATMQSNDFKILANTQDTLMTYEKDENGEYKLVPLLATADTTDEGLTWKIKINGERYWYDFSTGKQLEKITVNDILNTAKYALNSKNGSELSADWRTFVKGADEITDKDIAKDDWSKLGATVDGDTLTLTLKYKAPYFNSVLTTGSFAPTPSVALDLGYHYGRDINYDKTLLTGPYYVESYKNSQLLTLKRNPNYSKDNKGTVDKINYFYTSNSNAANNRQLFETGDVDEAIVAPSDTYGYKHYVDKFDGLQKVDNNLIGSKYLWFNFSKKHKDGIKEEDKESNRALSYDSVRTLIFYGLNRATLVKYFAGSSDEKVINDFISNTFNPSGYLKIGDKDYADVVSAETGNGAYYHSKDISNGKTLDQLVADARKDLKENVQLTFLASGLNATTFNPYIRQMFAEFNDIPNNPIKINIDETSDDAQYQQAQLDGNYSMFITGETPTYLDPMSFLVNLKSNGSMSAYDGMKRLFDRDTGKADAKAAKDFGLDENSDLLKLIETYSKNLDSVNEGTDAQDSRYQKFADIEKEILFKDKTILPLYKPNGKYTYNLSYISPTTRPNRGFGYQDYKLDKVKLYKTIQKLIDSGELKKPETKQKEVFIKQN